MAFQTDFQNQIKDPKQKRLLIVVAVVFIGIGIVLWRTFFTSSIPTEIPLASKDAAAPVVNANNGPKSPTGGFSERDIKTIKLDTVILKSSLFQELRTYSTDIPVKVLEKGNPDPFRQPEDEVAPAPSASALPPVDMPDF